MRTTILAASGSILLASAAQAQWGVNGTRVYYLGGNVGVGTSNPLYPMHVRTTSAARAVVGENLALTGSTYGVWGQTASTNGRGTIGFATALTGATNGVFGRSDSVRGRAVFGLAPSATGETFGVWGESASSSGTGVFGNSTAAAGDGYGVWGHSAGTSGRGVFGSAVSATGYAGYFEGGRNYFAGRVGIGTLDPAEMLHVAGNIRVPNTAVIGGIVGNFNGGSLTIQAPGNESSHGVAWAGGELRLRAGACNKSHSGTPPPVGTSNGNDVVIQAGDNVFAGVGNTVWNGNIRFIAGNALPERMRIVGDTGNVGIGTTDPGSFRLAVSGTAAKTGGGSWSSFSDARLKTNIEPLRGTLDRLLSLHGYSFNYLPEAVERRLALPGTQIGLLAQEVEAVFPDWVSEDADGYKYVTERATTALLVEALRDLRVEKEAQIQRLRDENAALAARLDRLEAALADLAAAGRDQR